MLGVLLGIAVWILGFLGVGLGVLALSGGGLAGVFDAVFTWAQVPVVGLTYLVLHREGVPSGCGELKAALAWVGDAEADGDPADAPFNSTLVALELGAGTLALVGLVLCTVFSISIVVAALGALGGEVTDPTTLSIAGARPSGAFATFLAGGLLWQVALFVEAFEST